ncbi:hypothetical protein B0293_29405 [Amycolatopsis azurea DSM 43854]|uniref:Uncharacterized protein n=1 Tax=Amycolatopsis azurea DSM 43854 TaxID=1238180 RepID=M2NYE8_9PSEU|nr:hypothetical protein C791_1980 [Amycolatopsis azurea DSM 43854]OOC03253.1 hypothetical protein B0293_29405 [Amycolatopsis azurea DSM 43854]
MVASSVGSSRSEGWFTYAPVTPYGIYQGLYGVEMSHESNTAIAVTIGDVGRIDGWFFAAFAIFVGTVLFYAVLAKRAGNGMPWWKVALIAVGGLVAILLADLVGFSEFDMPGDVRTAVMLTLGLVALAWLDRSVLVLVVAAAFVLCSVVLAQGPLALMLSSLVALAGAFAALLSRPKAAAEET